MPVFGVDLFDAQPGALGGTGWDRGCRWPIGACGTVVAGFVIGSAWPAVPPRTRALSRIAVARRVLRMDHSAEIGTKLGLTAPDTRCRARSTHQNRRGDIDFH